MYMPIYELSDRPTMQELAVDDLISKINPYRQKLVHPFTFLHDNERETLSEFVLEHKADDLNAQYARDNEPYNLIELSKSAYSILLEQHNDRKDVDHDYDDEDEFYDPEDWG